jgi:hypothetical protein
LIVGLEVAPKPTNHKHVGQSYDATVGYIH